MIVFICNPMTIHVQIEGQFALSDSENAAIFGLLRLSPVTCLSSLEPMR